MVKILALCGPTGAGKSSAAEIARQRFDDIQVVSTGNAIRTLLQERGLDASYNNLQQINDELVNELGDSYISIVFRFFNDKYSHFIIDSVRRVADITCLRKTYANVGLLAIEAPVDTRYTRINNRHRAMDAIDKKSFADMMLREATWGLSDVVAMADATIVNSGDRTQFERAILDFLGSYFNDH